MPYRRRCLARWSAALLLGGALLSRAAPETPVLSIVAPATGSTVLTGRTLLVTVSVPPGRFPRGVALLGEYPLGSAAPQVPDGPTLQFRIATPAGSAPGMYTLTAAGVGEDGPLAVSVPLQVQVERTDPPIALDLGPPSLMLTFVGQTRSFTAIATFADGTHSDVGRSARFTATSSQPAVATARNATVVARGSGRALIELRYGPVSARLPVEVPPQVAGDLNADGRIDQADVDLLTAALHQPVDVPGDARDLNHDGVIDELDAAILVSRCTRRGCGP